MHDESPSARVAVKPPNRLRWLAEFAVVRSLICLIQLLSPRQADGMARFLAWLASDVFGVRRKVASENLLAVYPDLDRRQVGKLLRQMWYHLIRMGCEIVLAPRKVHWTNWRRYVRIPDKRQMTGHLIDYRPLLAVTGHFGNFEMAGYVIGLLGMPSYTVARTLDNPWLNRFVNDFRELNGQYLLPKDGSALRVGELLGEGQILTILGDQHAGTKGCWVEFLGRPAACHKAVALFTLNGRAPMMVSYCRQLDQPLQFEIGCTGVADPMHMPPELQDVKALTQWYNDRLADVIGKAPAQYWWLHRRWRDKPVRVTARSRAAA